MAVTAFGGGYKMTAANDVLNNATVGASNVTTPFRVRIKAIAYQTGAATGRTTIRNGGTSGTVLFDSTTGPPVNETATMLFGSPIEVDDFAVSAIGTNVNVLVYVA